MIVVSVPTDKAVDKDGNFTPPWGNYFDQNTQQMQQSLSNEGFWIPSVSTSDLAIIAASYGQQTGVNLGTLVYDSTANQLKVFLSDSATTGSFHVITTS